jgi:hypothetical protein
LHRGFTAAYRVRHVRSVARPFAPKLFDPEQAKLDVVRVRARPRHDIYMLLRGRFRVLLGGLVGSDFPYPDTGEAVTSREVD